MQQRDAERTPQADSSAFRPQDNSLFLRHFRSLPENLRQETNAFIPTLQRF